MSLGGHQATLPCECPPSLGLPQDGLGKARQRGLSQGAKWWDKGHGAGPVHLGEGGQMGAGGKQGGLGGEKA